MNDSTKLQCIKNFHGQIWGIPAKNSQWFNFLDGNYFSNDNDNSPRNVYSLLTTKTSPTPVIKCELQNDSKKRCYQGHHLN